MGRVRDGRNAALGALVASALAAGAFTPTPTANATCMSAFGLNNGNGCTSNLTTLAIAIGNGAVANAGNALFGGAIAIGDGANVLTNIAAFTFGGAFGDRCVLSNARVRSSESTCNSGRARRRRWAARSISYSVPPLLAARGQPPAPSASATSSIQFGPGTASTVGGFNVVDRPARWRRVPKQPARPALGNLSLQIGAGTVTTVGLLNLAFSIVHNGGGLQSTAAGGIGAWALNFFGDAGSVFAQGDFTTAANILGTNTVAVQGLFSAAANLIGNWQCGSAVVVTGFPVLLSLVVNAFGIDNILDRAQWPVVLHGVVQPGGCRRSSSRAPASTSTTSTSRSSRCRTSLPAGSAARPTGPQLELHPGPLAQPATRLAGPAARPTASGAAAGTQRPCTPQPPPPRPLSPATAQHHDHDDDCERATALQRQPTATAAVPRQRQAGSGRHRAPAGRRRPAARRPAAATAVARPPPRAAATGSPNRRAPPMTAAARNPVPPAASAAESTGSSSRPPAPDSNRAGRRRIKQPVRDPVWLRITGIAPGVRSVAGVVVRATEPVLHVHVDAISPAERGKYGVYDSQRCHGTQFR